MKPLKTAILSTEKICKTFSNYGKQQHVLKNLDLDIYAGDFTVIMGPSGAGKTTLLHTLSGMEKPTLGHVRFDGQDISTYSDTELADFRKTHCGFVFQQHHLFDYMSITDNILLSGLLISNNKKQIYKKATGLLEQTGIFESDWKKFPSQLSGGQLQRVCLVRGIINEPDILFADEPTGSLDSASSNEMLDLLTLFHQNGQSIVMVTHDMQTALRGNRILYLKDGNILGECHLDEYTNPKENTNRQDTLKRFLEGQGW